MSSAMMLKVAHWSMAITFALAVALIFITYGAEWNLSIPVLIFLHILFVVFAAAFKIS